MKVLLLTAYFPPDAGSAAHLFYELGTALVGREHQVTVLTSMPGYHCQESPERYQGKRWIREKVNGMDVVRLATPRLPRHLMVGRALWQFGGALAFFLVGLRLPRPDVVVVYSPPLPLGLVAYGLRRLKGTPFILNVQDLFPQSIIDLGLLKNKWLIRVFEGMECFVYRQAEAITVHSEGNRRHVEGRLGKQARATGEERKRGKVGVIPNWVDTEFIQPGERMNGFREVYNLGEAFVVSFAGVLGYSQDVDVVLDAARLVSHHPAVNHQPIHWLIVGDGVEKMRVQARAKRMGLDSVRFLPMQPRERYPAVLHASDVGLTTLRKKVKTPVVPSKILSIMAAGRPVVAAVNLDGDAPRLIEAAGCGFCIPPEDPHALKEAVLALYRDPALRREMGRKGREYVMRHFSLLACSDQWEELLRRVVGVREAAIPGPWIGTERERGSG